MERCGQRFSSNRNQLLRRHARHTHLLESLRKMPSLVLIRMTNAKRGHKTTWHLSSNSPTFVVASAAHRCAARIALRSSELSSSIRSASNAQDRCKSRLLGRTEKHQTRRSLSPFQMGQACVPTHIISVHQSCPIGKVTNASVDYALMPRGPAIAPATDLDVRQAYLSALLAKQLPRDRRTD